MPADADLDPRTVTFWPKRPPRNRRVERYWERPEFERERARRYHALNREQRAERRKRVYERNAEAERQRARDWNARNAQRKREAARARYRADPQKFVRAATQREAALRLVRAVLDALEPPRLWRVWVPGGCPRARLVARNGVVTAIPSWKVAKKGPPQGDLRRIIRLPLGDSDAPTKSRAS